MAVEVLFDGRHLAYRCPGIGSAHPLDGESEPGDVGRDGGELRNGSAAKETLQPLEHAFSWSDGQRPQVTVDAWSGCASSTAIAV